MTNDNGMHGNMGLAKAVIVCFKKYVDFSGRAQRSEFWWWTLFATIINLFFSTAAAADDAFFTWLVPYLIILLPSMAVTVRRLRDVGKSAWWLLPSYGAFLIFLISLPLGTSHWLGYDDFGLGVFGSELYYEIVSMIGLCLCFLSLAFFIVIFIFALQRSKSMIE